MQIISTQFIKGLTFGDESMDFKFPQVVFIGRSNVGKSSIINTLTKTKNLAKTSALPGRTRQANIFLINNKFYLIDLPGYGYAKTSKENQDELHDLINWYLFVSSYQPEKVILVIDAVVGPTKDDLEILQALQEADKKVVIIANKIDKLKKSERLKQFKKIQQTLNNDDVLFCSTKTGEGLSGTIDKII